MDSKEFLDFGKAMIDFVANYTDNIRDRNVLADVEPGYLFKLLPEEAPQKPGDWQQVLIDVERYILPGVTHWNSPNFHAFYPTGNSYPSIVADILSAAIGCIGLTWIASPACTELEVITLNWMGKLLGLPKQFLYSSEGFGGGVIQGSASETTLIALLTAREQTTRRMKQLHPDLDEATIKNKLVAYTSDQSNSSVEKGGILASISMRLLPTDDKCALRGETLLKAVKEDLEKGLIPCCVISTLGTTGTCAFDKLDELGPICKEYNMWLHVDAAYAGAAFICAEYRHLMSGAEYSDSFVVNAHKWLLVNFDCSLFWVKDSRKLIETFNVERIYLEHNKQGPVPEYRHWQVPLGRRFRSLKIWFLLRIYGSEGIEQYIRHTIQMAEMFENYVKSDSRFELTTERSMSLVCFRLRGDDRLTKELIDRLTERRKLYVIAATHRGKLIVRFTVGSRITREEDITFAWEEITSQATEILQSLTAAAEREVHESLKNSAGDIALRIKSLNIESKTQKISDFASSKGGKEKDIPPCPKLARFETCQLDPCMLDPCKPEPTVVIVGAGMAGLSAAHRLAQCGLQNFTILEATDRPGGRIHSCWLGDVVAEMGATWIEGGCVANPVFTLAAQEGLLKPPLFRPDPSRGLFCTSDGRAIDLPVSITAYHTFRQIEQQAATLFSLGCGRTHGTLLNFMGVRIQQELHNFPEEQRYDAARVMYGMTNCVRCRCGDDLSLVSADQFGSYIEIPGGNVRVPLGYVGVLAPLLRDLPSCALKYCKPVSCIRWGAISDSCPRAVVKCCDGEEFPADYVIVTVSLGVLKHQHDKLFCPALPAEKVEAICKLGYGYVNKIFLEYARPFWVWKEGGIKLAWSADELADRCDWVKGISIVEELSTSQHVLCAWVCGREAADMELCSDEEVVESITRVLRQFTGDPTLPYPANLLRSKWCMDQYFAGSCSYMGMDSTVGHQCDLASPLPGTCEPIPPILLFAGEATIPGHYSTVHGARLSGIREAERIIQLTKRFGGPPTKTSDNS